MLIKLTQEQLTNFIDRVRGTTLSMDRVLEEAFGVPDGIVGLDPETHAAIDAAVFECTGCSWICGIDELDSDESDCDHCASEGE